LIDHFGSFGIRIHAGECFDKAESNHVAILEHAISHLRGINGLKIRIGHGRLLFTAQKWFSDKSVLEFIKKNVALEVNNRILF